MKGLRNNLKFEYLYRDAANYKQFGCVVLNNPTKIDPELATKLIREHLIDGEFFLPEKIQVPFLEQFDYNPEIDHDWYEFEKFSLTEEEPTQSINAQDFLDTFICFKSIITWIKPSRL